MEQTEIRKLSTPGLWKHRLLAGIPVHSPLKYTDHVEDTGIALNQRVCKLDLEGIVANGQSGPYGSEREHRTWFKILNRNYCRLFTNIPVLPRCVLQ